MELSPLKATSGVELFPKSSGIASARVRDGSDKQNLPWDRFVRLASAAEEISKIDAHSVLDIGGYDGALCYFLSDKVVDVVDPVTTGGSILGIDALDCSYDVVSAIDVLEHIEPKDRSRAIQEIARVARKSVVLNYPCRDSLSAQKLVYNLTGNEFIKEHVQWELPDSNWVLAELAKYRFKGNLRVHTSIAIWLGQFLTSNLAPDAGYQLNKYLIENFFDEPTTKPLYHLIVCEKKG